MTAQCMKVDCLTTFYISRRSCCMLCDHVIGSAFGHGGLIRTSCYPKNVYFQSLVPAWSVMMLELLREGTCTDVVIWEPYVYI